MPQFAELGPDALAVEEDEFVRRLARHSGQIKSTLTNQKFMAGIGNAYSDEILWEARLHPHRRRATMDEERPAAGLYRAMRSAIEWALPHPRGRGRRAASTRATRSGVTTCASTARRDQPCPRCGEPIHSQVRGGSETNYCLHCQPLAFG